MVITKPTLPPKAGYVEVESNGVREYKLTPEKAEEIRLASQIQALTERNEFLEDLIAELAVQVYSTPPNV